MNEWNYKFLFSNKDKFIKMKWIDEEFYPIIDFIYENKNKFINSEREKRVIMINEFINDKINTIDNINETNNINLKKKKNLFK